MVNHEDIAQGQSRQLGRFIAFGCSAISFGLISYAFIYGRFFAERGEGGGGFAMNSPIMLYVLGSLPFCYLGAMFLIASLWKNWGNIKRFPTPLTLLFLTPGLLITLTIAKAVIAP